MLSTLLSILDSQKFYAVANAICCHSKIVRELLRLCLFEIFCSTNYSMVVMAREYLNKLCLLE